MKTAPLQDWWLDQLKKSDRSELFITIDQNRKHLGKWLSFVEEINNEEDLNPFLDAVTGQLQSTSHPVFTIRTEQDLIGLVGLKPLVSDSYAREIGYWIIENMQGKGIMTSAVRKVLHMAFTIPGIERVLLKCGTENRASRRIAEKLGFIFLKTETKGEKMGNGTWIDLLHFQIRKQEYFDHNLK